VGFYSTRSTSSVFAVNVEGIVVATTPRQDLLRISGKQRTSFVAVQARLIDLEEDFRGGWDLKRHSDTGIDRRPPAHAWQGRGEAHPRSQRASRPLDGDVAPLDSARRRSRSRSTSRSPIQRRPEYREGRDSGRRVSGSKWRRTEPSL
jgi:hypothetical protein